MQRKNIDSYPISYNPGTIAKQPGKRTVNSIKFRKDKLYFPFDCYKLFKKLGFLRETLNDKDVCAVDLQSYPQEIFEETELKKYPELAKWVYNIVETWIINIEKLPGRNNPRLFDSFLKICEDLALKAKDPGEQPENEKIQNANANEINVFCKSMPLQVAIEHFKVFTEQNSKNGKPFLSMDQLNSFIDKAFKGKNNFPKIKFNQIPKGEKGLIQSVFYEFYNKNCFEYFFTMQCQENFIKLLTDNFIGWEYEKLKGNFKPKTNKRL